MSNGQRNAQQRVWQALYDTGRAMTMREVMNASGLGKATVCHCLAELRRRGYARRVSKAVYHAHKYRSRQDTPPPNNEGKNPNSRNYSREKSYAARLRRVTVEGDQSRWKLNIKRHLGHPLAQAWPGVKEAA